ncbi:MAG: SDR family oxidoreductase [Candidatus Thiodiazotropha sp. (ex Ctena orbiculata)]|uniref:SDR family oxidoreductase n=1 Tax=Candidatus Thiodiazotropha taylori TaxID=2792791 RepID=A0A944M5E5_9GAMM|nr:SDR family oxidoreductase [Candidatus Thiodiazotropha taylori]PVV16426.1 MAG: NAD(P)-dependent oxidoreductase [gamma proteobacterium symbiont of Ctena orbiculata]MBT2987418.1 SDR family oxidoreductase [Candidatus Thiodiazotropha taylori]MBT2995328.1 SDR family oxidoreductase [Candidatus Thiodiazotropha taylori]MBT3001788.1 SDR family oxidoreductase [Candidatus Thiodiazotropha taylori]
MAVTIVGCGDIGTRVALACRADGSRVTAWVRTPESAQRLRRLGVNAVQADLDRALAPDHTVEEGVLYYFAPPPPKGRQDSRVGRFIARLNEGPPPEKVVYLSTSGVYGDCRGAWVDETRTPAPTADRAIRRLDAEAQWHAWSERTGLGLVILRVAGIYGPGKLPLQRLRSRQPMVAEADAPITNHIHSLDLVRIARIAMQRAPSGEVYNVCDGAPEPMTSYFNQVADFLKLPRPPVISLEEAQRQLSPGMLSYLKESRRLSNRKLLEELGVELAYPSLEQGLQASLSIE